MKLLFDFFPIILFFVSYYQASFLVENTFIGQLINPEKPEFITATIIATGIAIVASFVQVAIHWFNTRKFERMHIFSLVLITVLGGITIFLGNPAFIQWKPTVLNWLFAAVFLGSMHVGERPIIQRMMGEHIELPENVWRTLNLSWVTFFFISGAANLYVAFYYNIEAAADDRMDTWVNFKLFGLMGLTIGFVILQALYLSRHISEDDLKKADQKKGDAATEPQVNDEQSTASTTKRGEK
jgi:intracellular septation protein